VQLDETLTEHHFVQMFIKSMLASTLHRSLNQRHQVRTPLCPNVHQIHACLNAASIPQKLSQFFFSSCVLSLSQKNMQVLCHIKGQHDGGSNDAGDPV
jgi:hypothetical protein